MISHLSWSRLVGIFGIAFGQVTVQIPVSVTPDHGHSRLSEDKVTCFIEEIEVTRYELSAYVAF